MAKSDPDTWMWERARSLLDEADRIQRQFFQLVPPRDRRPCWSPPVDMFESPTDLLIHVALPGVASDDVDLVVDGAALVVSGDRPLPRGYTVIQRMEIPHGRFERRIELPRGRYRLTDHALAEGVLEIRLAKVRVPAEPEATRH